MIGIYSDMVMQSSSFAIAKRKKKRRTYIKHKLAIMKNFKLMRKRMIKIERRLIIKNGVNRQFINYSKKDLTQ